MIRRLKRNSKKKIIFALIGLLILLIILMVLLILKDNKEKQERINKQEKIIDIKKHYNDIVVTNKNAKVFNKENNNYKEIGKLTKGTVLNLEEVLINEEMEYFLIKNNNLNYYIYYEDVNPSKQEYIINDRYKKYIEFNENIVTKASTNFYDKDDNWLYTINKSFNFPIIVKDTDKYGVVFNNVLVYVKDVDVENIIDSNNTPLKNSKGIPVLNYHFVYEKNDNTCNEIICHSEEQIISHFAYIKDNNYFTPTMKELEMYIDGKVQLPEKSVVITFDDGVRAKIARKYVDMYELNATLFLITSWFSKDEFESDYMEVHSHGDNLHNVGVCPGGQGGAIKCLEKDKLLVDLKESRSKLNNTTVFCYPFYEYNQYSIDVLKEAGYTMAFAGEYASGKTRVTVGSDKFRLPRWVIVNYTSFDLFKDYIS